MAMPPVLECKDTNLIYPHAIVGNIKSGRGRSTRGKAGRGMLGRRATEASARQRARRSRRKVGKASRQARRQDTDESDSSHDSSESAAFEPSEDTSSEDTSSEDTSTSESAEESDYDERENAVEARMPRGQIVGKGPVKKASRVMVFFALPHGWSAGSVRGACRTNPECNFDVVYRERDGQTRVYPQLLDEERRGKNVPGSWVVLERARK